MAVKKKYDRNVLGRGLDQIDNGRGLDALIDTHSEVKTEGSSNLNEVSITQITPNPNQPTSRAGNLTKRLYKSWPTVSANWESFSPLPCAKWRVRNTRLLPVSAVGVPHNWLD